MTQLQQILSTNEYSFKSNVNALDTIEDLLVKDMREAIIVSTQSVSLLLGSVVRKVNSGFYRMVMVKPNILKFSILELKSLSVLYIATWLIVVSTFRTTEPDGYEGVSKLEMFTYEIINSEHSLYSTHLHLSEGENRARNG